MTYWAIEYLTNSSGRRRTWFLDLKTIRRTRYEARQAPLDLDQSAMFWDEYNERWRAGTVRAVKLRIEKALAPLPAETKE